jgi:hypothetical protein
MSLHTIIQSTILTKKEVWSRLLNYTWNDNGQVQNTNGFAVPNFGDLWLSLLQVNIFHYLKILNQTFKNN